jgi:hypothetical protein
MFARSGWDRGRGDLFPFSVLDMGEDILFCWGGDEDQTRNLSRFFFSLRDAKH